MCVRVCVPIQVDVNTHKGLSLEKMEKNEKKQKMKK